MFLNQHITNLIIIVIVIYYNVIISSLRVFPKGSDRLSEEEIPRGARAHGRTTG